MDNLPVLVGRISDAAYDLFAFLEPLGGDHDHVKGIPESSKRCSDPCALLTMISQLSMLWTVWIIPAKVCVFNEKPGL